MCTPPMTCILFLDILSIAHNFKYGSKLELRIINDQNFNSNMLSPHDFKKNCFYTSLQHYFTFLVYSVFQHYIFSVVLIISFCFKKLQ